MRVRLKTDDKTTTYRSFTKRKILGVVTTMASRKVGTISGTVRVDYGDGDYNEFSFIGPIDYRKKLEPCLDKELLDYMGVKWAK